MKRKLVGLASNLFPNLIANYAYKQLTNPQVRKLRENELNTLDKAKKEKFKFKLYPTETAELTEIEHFFISVFNPSYND